MVNRLGDLAGNSPSNDARVSAALNLISAQYHDPNLSLVKITRSLGISTWYFSRLFKGGTGIGFRAYLRNVRLSRAEELLGATFLSIKEVAASVGYKHVSDFDHHFKRRYGTRPSIYRAKMHREPPPRTSQSITSTHNK